MLCIQSGPLAICMASVVLIAITASCRVHDLGNAETFIEASDRATGNVLTSAVLHAFWASTNVHDLGGTAFN